MKTKRLRFERDSASALKNQKLQGALRNATDRFRTVREKATGEIKGWENLRIKAREIKKHTVEHLDQYLEILEENIMKAGGTVHWAKDGNEACSIILDIARSNNVRSVVKSKSMATEEIELNHALEGAGIKVVETDLGEYIIQIAKERPSHILAPAIHKTKEDIGKLFAEKLNTEPGLERSRPGSVFSFSAKSFPMSSFVLCIAGASIWDGRSFAIWIIYSPRSVSTTFIPAPSRA